MLEPLASRGSTDLAFPTRNRPSATCLSQPVHISFCTTCCNRAYQLKLVFDANYELIQQNPRLEWVVVNFGSADDLDPFVQDRLPDLCDRFVYVRLTEECGWHLSVAKNLAHHSARGEILVNLDCDNFIADSPAVVERHFAKGVRVLHLWSGISHDGTCGKIAITRELFQQIGGYDESLWPMGYQDLDLLNRVSALRVPVVQASSSTHSAIKNSKQQSIRFCSTEGMTWTDYNRLNRELSDANLAAGRLVANLPNGRRRLKTAIYHGGRKVQQT
jgi:glycosyltransferase involved in cell wall biosynthesis